MAYRDEFDRYQDDVYWTLPRLAATLVVVMVFFSFVGLGACAIGLFSGAADNAAKVIQKEFYPDALLRKYEWFKDASAALDKKQADITVYDARLKFLNDQYVGLKRAEWPRDDREQSSIWQSELAGVKASYNSLAAEYNSEMVKFNYQFANLGELPRGGQPVPREYRPYQQN